MAAAPTASGSVDGQPTLARHVCVRVPRPGEARRSEYEGMTREAWARHCLGEGGVYVGRPKNDGGWYQSGTVKAGSMFANPYPVPEFALGESLERFRAYLEARLAVDASTASTIELLPPKPRDLARRRFSKGAENPSVGKSVAHLELGIVGEGFRARLRGLAGKRLGCFCDEADPCHAKLLGEVATQLSESTARSPPRCEAQDQGELPSAKRPRGA